MLREFDPPLPDGIYFDLAPEPYFRQETRGSSDWVRLRRRRHGWWWSSAYCPRYVPPKKTELVYGSALHAILLEGVAAYESRFAVSPAKTEFKKLVVTIEEMQLALVKHGFTEWPKAWKAPDFATACRVNIPSVPCWPNIVADFEEAIGTPGQPGARTAVSADEDYQMRFMREMATGDFPGNEAIRKLLTDPDHPPMAEISVLATVDGIRRRWRFDRMYPRLDMDLKSLGNWTGRPLEFAVGDQLARLGWAIQRADYFFGRQQAYRMIAERGEGCMAGGTPEQRKWLATWPEEYPAWDWCWLAFQKPSTSGAAPVLFPVWEDSFDRSGDPSYLRKVGEHQLADAIAFYQSMVEAFGLDRPWGRVDPLHYTEPGPGRTNLITLPNWIGEDMPTEENAYL